MSDENQIIPLPEQDAHVDWLNFSLDLDFYPPIKLTRKAGLEFAKSISDCLEPEELQLDSNEWAFSGGASCEGVCIKVGKRYIRIFAKHPVNGLEWYERKFDNILHVFYETFEPEIILRSRVLINGVLDLPEDEDARAFLGGYVMLMHPSKISVIERPLHILGVRLYFPPFEGEQSDVEWGVDARVESWGEDTGKLFLQAEAVWEKAQKWEVNSDTQMVEKLSTVSNFITDRLVDFLRQPPFPEIEDDTNEN